jgi:hypothetical protein
MGGEEEAQYVCERVKLLSSVGERQQRLLKNELKNWEEIMQAY